MNFKYIRRNALVTQRLRRRQLHWGLTILIAFSLLYIDPIVAILFYLASMAVTPQYHRLKAGAIGELRALGIKKQCTGALSELPDDYCVYNNVIIPAGNTTCEIDILVIGPNGIFIVEVKHMTGRIIGQADDKTWLQARRPNSRTFKSPIKQVNRQVYWLKQLLNESNIQSWIQPIVVFTHPYFELDVISNRIPVLPLSELSVEILIYEPPYPQSMPGLPNILIRDILIAMRNPSGKLSFLKMFAADCTGKHEWMVDYIPPRIVRYFGQDCINPEQKIADIMCTQTQDTDRKVSG
jgi:hypothetical protein